MKKSLLSTALFLSFAAAPAVAQSQTHALESPDAPLRTAISLYADGLGTPAAAAGGASHKAFAPKAKAESSGAWLFDHMHQAVVNGNEDDYYYKHDDEGTLRQIHKLTANGDDTYTHVYNWYMYALGELQVSRHVEAVNNSTNDFIHGVTSEVRFGTNRTDEAFTMKRNYYRNGSQKPYMLWVLTYKYNDLAQITSAEVTLTDYDSDGKVVQERPYVKRTYEYGADMRPTSMVYTENAYNENTDGTEPYKLATTTTLTYSDIKYAGAATADMPADIGSDTWDEWMFGSGSNIASYSVAFDKADFTDGSQTQNYTYTVTCTYTHDGDKSSFSSVTYRPDTGYWHKRTKRTTDALGSFVFEQQAHVLGAGEEPSDANLNFSSRQTKLWSSADDYEETVEYFNPNGMTEMKTMNTISRKAEHDPVYGYVTKASETHKMYDVFSQEDREVAVMEIAYTYDAYHRAGESESTGISSATADGGAQPAAIYNIMGQRLKTVQPGINIVNGKKVLVRK